MDMQAAFLGVHPPDLTEVDQLLKEGDVLRWGSFEAQVIHTPVTRRAALAVSAARRGKNHWRPDNHFSHRRGWREISIAELLKKTVDPENTREERIPDESEVILPPAPSFFLETPCLPGASGHRPVGGSLEQIMDSLRSKLMHLPDATVVHPATAPSPPLARSVS